MAVRNHFDSAAVLLFLILVVWQMPHFYAIAVRRLDEYKAAGIPVLPVKKGVFFTKINILIYVITFVIISVLFTVFNLTGFVYLAIMMLLGLTWFGMGIQGFRASDNARWARKMFLFSLVVLLGFCLTLSIDAIIKV